MSGFQRGSVVGSVARDRYHLTSLLECLDKAFLVHRSRSGDDFDVVDAVKELFVVERGKFGAGDDVAVTVGLVVPQTYLAAYLAGGPGCVAGDDFDSDAGVDALGHRVGHVGAHGVRDGRDAEEGKIGRGHPSVADSRIAGSEFLIGKSEGAHRHVLIFEQPGVDLFLGDPFGNIAAHGEDDFRRALDIKDSLAGRAVYDRRHVFALGRERQFLDCLGAVFQRAVVDSLTVEPQQERALGRVAENLDGCGVALVELCGRVGCDALGDDGAERVGAELFSFESVEVGAEHLHPVLGQSAGLVGTDNRCRSHSLAGMELAHEVVGFQHAPHRVGEAERHGHRQSLGDGTHNEGDGNHYCLQEIGYE